VFLCKEVGQAPPAMISNLRHNKVLHDTTLLVSIQTTDVPRVAPSDRLTVTEIAPYVHQVVLCYGFMEEPDVPAGLSAMRLGDWRFMPDEATYFIGRESVIAQEGIPGMHPAFENLFVLLNRGADSAARFFNLPPARVFEVGTQVEI
jgi:KUP system potassium uptake protein